MTVAAQRGSASSSHDQDRSRRTRRRLERPRHIHSTTHAQQITLSEDVRSAHRCKQTRGLPAHSDSMVLNEELDKKQDLAVTEAHLREQILAFLPDLKVFALSLTHDPVRADDLVQNAVLRAWINLDQFRRGTNHEAWLLTILRNSFYSEFRKHRREVEDADGAYARSLNVQPEQDFKLLLKDLQRALAQLPLEQREALILVGSQGETYEEAAAICGVAVGTIKSRVSRARHHLAQLLQMKDQVDFGPDHLMRAALQQRQG